MTKALGHKSHSCFAKAWVIYDRQAQHKLQIHFVEHNLNQFGRHFRLTIIIELNIIESNFFALD